MNPVDPCDQYKHMNKGDQCNQVKCIDPLDPHINTIAYIHPQVKSSIASTGLLLSVSLGALVTTATVRLVRIGVSSMQVASWTVRVW